MARPSRQKNKAQLNSPDSLPPPDSLPRPADPSPMAHDAMLPRRLTPQWVAAMLFDVTAHLMTAIDKASRIREPLDRIADAAEASALGRTATLPTARSRLLAILKNPLTVVVLLGLALTIPYFVHNVLSARLAADVAYMQPPGSAELTLHGVKFRGTRELLEQRLAAVAPEPIKKYSIVVGGRRFPVKQAVAIGLGAPRSDFDSDQAIRVLKRLGYHIDETTP